jgi:hypothetical protein
MGTLEAGWKWEPQSGAEARPGLELARFGPFVCLYCTRTHEVQVELERRRLRLDPDRFFDLLQELAQPEPVSGVRRAGAGAGSARFATREQEILRELLPTACASLLMLLVRGRAGAGGANGAMGGGGRGFEGLAGCGPGGGGPGSGSGGG